MARFYLLTLPLALGGCSHITSAVGGERGGGVWQMLTKGAEGVSPVKMKQNERVQIES